MRKTLDEAKQRIVRLAVALRMMDGKRPDLVPGFLAARSREDCLALNLFMGISSEVGWQFGRKKVSPSTRRRWERARRLESQDFSIETHYALMARLWPERYVDPPLPRPASVASFGALVRLRKFRQRRGKHLYAPGDVMNFVLEWRRLFTPVGQSAALKKWSPTLPRDKKEYRVGEA